jgi:cytochrome c biogenesis protein
VLVAAVVMIAGLLLSLRVRRRRIWVRTVNDDAGRTVIEAGGLGRTDSGAFVEEFAAVVSDLQSAVPPARAGGNDEE